MKVLKFLVAGCVLLWLGWFFLIPGQNSSEQAGITRLKNQVASIHDHFSSKTAQNELKDPSEIIKAAMEPLPEESAFKEVASSNLPADMLRPKDDTELITKVKPDQNPESIVIKDEPVKINPVDSKPFIPEPDENTTFSMDADWNQTDQADELKLSDAEIEHYTERIQTAGTNAISSLEEVSRLLGR